MLSRILRKTRNAPIILCGVVGACLSGEDPIIVQEKLSISISCQAQATPTTCTNLHKFIIPENLDLHGKPIRKVELSDLILEMGSEPESNQIQIRHLIVTIYSQGASNQRFFLTVEPELVVLEELVVNKRITLPLDEVQMKSIEATLKSTREVLIFVGTQLVGEQSTALFKISATATVQY